jgi:hypothetical protein
MMPELLEWYALLSRSKYFKWARLWGSLAALLIGLWCWCVAQGEWGWVLTLLVPIFILGSSALEALAKAYQATSLTRYLAPLYLSAEKETPPEAAKPEEDGPVLDLTDESKLALCQFYSFLYVLFALKKSGEATLGRMLGLPARRYRDWIKALASDRLQLVTVTSGKITLTDLDFEKVLERLAHYTGQAYMWDFPRLVYAHGRNWRKFDPTQLILEPDRTATLNRERGPSETPPLFPIYPHHLNDLNFEANC